MKQNDVIVIGGGIAGLFAAITAARRGKQVLLMTKGVGALAIAGGTVDVYGYDAGGAPVRNPAAALTELIRPVEESSTVVSWRRTKASHSCCACNLL